MTFWVFQSGPCARRTTAAGVGLVAVLLLPSVAMADEVDGGSDEQTETVDPSTEPEPVRPAGPYPYVLAVINGGVVTNVAALSYENDYSGVWASLRASNDAVLRVPVGSAGIGWVVLPDGSLAPPKPRAGMVWNGEEWRAPGTESVQRPSDVRGWMTGRSEPVDRVSGDDRDGTGTFVDSWMFGLLIVPDDALDAGATREQLADRSIVMLETSGGTIPFLARFDGLARLLERVDEALDSAIAVHEASTGATVPEPEQQGLRSAARRVVEPLLRLFGVGAAISIRPFG